MRILVEVVKTLSANGANVDAGSKSGKTALSIAFQEGHPEILPKSKGGQPGNNLVKSFSRTYSRMILPV